MGSCTLCEQSYGFGRGYKEELTSKKLPVCEECDKVLSALKMAYRLEEFNLFDKNFAEIRARARGRQSEEILKFCNSLKDNLSEKEVEVLENRRRNAERVKDMEITPKEPTYIEYQKNEDVVSCPKCGSEQLTTNKKGVSVGKAFVGGVLAGPAGIVVGGLGSNKVIITCLKCGNQWKAGEL